MKARMNDCSFGLFIILPLFCNDYNPRCRHVLNIIYSMKKRLFILFVLAGFSQTSFAQFVVKETDFQWFSLPSDHCAIEAIAPQKDGTIEINTFTQRLSAVMIQSGIFAGSANGYKYYPLMNTKKFDAELKLKSNVDDYYNYRMFLPQDKWEKNLFMMLKDRMGENITVHPDSNFLPDMIRKYPHAVKTWGEGEAMFHVIKNDPPKDKENKYITIFGNAYYQYDQRANTYLEKPVPTAFINPVIEKRSDGKKMESTELLTSADRSIMQRYAFLTPTGDEEKWAMYKHRIIVTYDKEGVKTNEAKVDLNFPRNESFVSEVRNVEDNSTEGFLYVYHRVFGLGKKSLDTVMGNYEVVYLDKLGNKKFHYTFKIAEKGGSFNPFVCYAKEGKINCLYFGHPDGKTMAVTSLLINPTGIENIQSMPLQEWRSLARGGGANLNSWSDDSFLLHDAIQDSKGFVYLIGEKRADSSIPPTGTNSFPTPIHIYPSHLVLVIGPDGKLVRQYAMPKNQLAVPVFEKTYTLINNDNGVFILYKDIVAPGSPKPFHTLTASDLSEVQRNMEPYDYKVSILGLNGAKVNEYLAPLPLYHSQKGFVLDEKKQNVYLLSINPQTTLPRLFKVALW